MGCDGDTKNFYMKDGLAYTEDHILIYNIFVYKIDKKISKPNVKEYFSKFGHVAAVNLRPCNRRYSRSTTKICFVNYATPADAASVLQKSNHFIRGHRVCVKASDSWRQPIKAEANNQDAAIAGNADENDVTVTLLQLDDDCLEYICKRLNIKDQVNFARTCTRFSSVFQMCAKREYKSVSVDDFNGMTLWEIREFFKNAGKFIEKIYGCIPNKDKDRIVEFLNLFSPQVQSVCFYLTKIKARLLRTMVEGLKNVRELHLRACSLNDCSILALKKLPNLEKLNLSENFDITGKHLSKLVQVKDLNLYGCSNIQAVNLSCAWKFLKDLRQLDIRRCERVTTAVFEDMVKNCHKLEVLKISCPAIKYELVATLPSLKSLELLAASPSVSIRLALFTALAEHKADQLETLKVVARNSITLECADMISRLKQLKKLICSNNDGLKDECLRSFGDLSSLEEIVLMNCSKITNDGLLHLLRDCTKLKLINVRRCRAISDDFVFRAIKMLKERAADPKEPVVCFVGRTGINEFITHHDEVINAQSHITLCFSSTVPQSVEDAEVNDYDTHDYLDYDYDDYDINDDFDADDDSFDFPFDVFHHFGDSDASDPYDSEEEDHLMHVAYNMYGGFDPYDVNNMLW